MKIEAAEAEEEAKVNVDASATEIYGRIFSSQHPCGG
jgi:hypothetical protein